jgi:hypothetical protein
MMEIESIRDVAVLEDDMSPADIVEMPTAVP